MDNIICGELLGPRVAEVSPMEDYNLQLTFDNGERRIFDVKPLFAYAVFKSLQDKAFFESVKVAYGSILWSNDIDYCPDTLYAESILVE
ncbi:MAG: DUF2442 domain-containing protein [Oscillospiraceae bacterium]|nr:DUF2442 domain-containing protein [Oscillospiraceae bacterium]